MGDASSIILSNLRISTVEPVAAKLCSTTEDSRLDVQKNISNHRSAEVIFLPPLLEPMRIRFSSSPPSGLDLSISFTN